MKKEVFQRLRNLFSTSEVLPSEAVREVDQLEVSFDEATAALGEVYAEVLDKLRKNPVVARKFDFVAESPAGSDAVLEAIEVKTDLSPQVMVEDLRTVVFGLQAHLSNLVEYYNSVIDRLSLDHQSELELLNQSVTNHQNEACTLNQQLQTQGQTILERDQQLSELNDQVASLNAQISTLQDKLKATPTTVEALDPKLSISKPEESFGKKLLAQMPQPLKEKLST